jgi:ParB family transcriptional regulator, chromosome partitioning protein
MTVLALDAIDVGARDRSDLGDIASLAASIKAVGLLHPIVVTASHALVAGGRRLAAVRSLGWTEAPVTVADLTNVADVLQAEADENTCRKALTPTEAERAARRRELVLAKDAKARQAHGQTAPGKNASPKLGEASRKQRETSKAAATGLGYSGTTLDKVKQVRTVSEDRDLPKPIRKAAREALAEMDRTGRVDGPAKNVAAIVSEHARTDSDRFLASWMGDDGALKRVGYRRRLFRAMRPLTALPLWSPEGIVAALDDEELREFLADIAAFNTWADKVRAARPRTLRIARGDH